MFVENNLQWIPHKHFSATSSTQRIAFVLTDACDLLGIGAIAEALECACSLETNSAARKYELQFLSESGGHIKCDRSLFVSTDELPTGSETRYARVFIAGGVNARATCDAPPLAAWLQRVRAHGTPVRFLAAGVDTSNMGAVMGSDNGAGVASGYEQARRRRAQLGSAVKAAFEVIRADFGEPIAHEALRRTAFVDSSEWLSPSVDATNTAVDRIRAAARWLQENCHRSVSVADAAEACAMSQRTLLRNFQTHIGASPSEYLQRVRLERACQLLAETSLPADKVARRVGLSNGDRLGKLFRRCVGKSPTEYRAWTRGTPETEAVEQGSDSSANVLEPEFAHDAYDEEKAAIA
ncbi:helix-turn-helix domain-containing protein [Paraburkholderia sabiae]|uniref:Helix-turn-helix domain-containing protein n=1 Tax=Paraburkholderia sabiae TaxID=273251 RepID=A0ABU9QEQ2_9BURK|nr:helix-turn-helix domain-containing protein [Paraburkholderia sabiae]WJZ76830.1 helix-turn-helix domain-containing protein [Paraburkholderia sabiae]CAD6546892.1 HTH-type transcriptional activator RhaS [Paraburkholderia sabiae]